MSKIEDVMESDIFKSISIISSLIGLVSTLLILIYSIFKGNWGLSFNAIVILLSIINFCLAITAIISLTSLGKSLRDIDELRRIESSFESEKRIIEQKLKISNKVQKNISRIMHNILHESRYITNTIQSEQNEVNEIIINSITSGSDDEIESFDKRLEIIQGSFKKYIIYILDNIKIMFDITTNDNCRVCIKLALVRENYAEEPTGVYDKELKDVHIKTFLRDSGSYRSCQQLDESIISFPYYENTAFKRILEHRYNDSFYLCNDLSQNKEYANYRDDYHKDYNATLVVPIRIKTLQEHDGNNGKVEYSILGFICVDNYDGNFKDDVDREILSGLGDHLFHIFRSNHQLQESMKNKKLIIT